MSKLVWTPGKGRPTTSLTLCRPFPGTHPQKISEELVFYSPSIFSISFLGECETDSGLEVFLSLDLQPSVSQTNSSNIFS